MWLLLHFQEVTSEVVDARQATALLRRHVRSYDKTRLVFADYQDRLDAAVERGRVLHGDATACGPDPSSTVGLLVQAIRQQRE